MKFTTKTEYGLIALIYMARNGKKDHWVTVKDIVQNEQYSSTYIEKIMQRLKNANIIESHKGKEGGYSLARHPSQITLKEIVDALEGNTFEVYCEPELRKDIVCTHFGLCGIAPVWRKTKEILDNYYTSVTLEELAKPEHEVQQVFKE